MVAIIFVFDTSHLEHRLRKDVGCQKVSPKMFPFNLIGFDLRLVLSGVDEHSVLLRCQAEVHSMVCVLVSTLFASFSIPSGVHRKFPHDGSEIAYGQVSLDHMRETTETIDMGYIGGIQETAVEPLAS